LKIRSRDAAISFL